MDQDRPLKPGVRRVWSWFGALALALCVSACGQVIDVPELDAGPDAPPTSPNSLEVEGDANLTLVFGEEVELMVRYLDDDRAPIADALVGFAFDGRAHDSSLSVLQSLSNDVGLATTRLRAGTSAGAFRVRVSAPGADAVFLDVAVSDRGFGELIAEPVYEGERPVVTIGAAVFAELTCDAPMTRRERGDRYRAPGPDDTSVTIVGLPAGVPFAVVGRGESGDGTLLAWVCRDGVEVPAEGSVSVPLVLEDLPQRAMGSYDVRLGFEVGGTRDRITEAVSDLDAALRDTGGSLLILDAAEARLLAAGEDDAAAGLVAARETGLDVSFAGSVARSRVGVERALLEASEVLTNQLGALDVHGVLRVNADGVEFDVASVLTGPTLDTVVPLDPTVGYEPGTEVRATVSERGDRLVVEDMSIFIRASGLTRAVLLQEAAGSTRVALLVDLVSPGRTPHAISAPPKFILLIPPASYHHSPRVNPLARIGMLLAAHSCLFTTY